jgi:hypothetical protein
MRTVCVLFLDIRGFTAMTRRRSAEETVALLNAFFAEIDRGGGPATTASSTSSWATASWRCSARRWTILRRRGTPWRRRAP